MLKKIVGTFSNKLLATLGSFLLVVLTSNYLGAFGRGEISLFIANIVIVQLVGNLISGTSLVYLTPRTKPILLLIPSYLWCFLASFLVVGCLSLFQLATSQFLVDLLIISIINNIITTNYMILLGREEVKKYNFLTLLVVIITLLYLLFSFFIMDNVNVEVYIHALYVAYTIVLIISFLYLRKEFVFVKFQQMKSTINQMVKLGVSGQFSNIITFINYRFSYYVLLNYSDKATLGIYSVGVALSEALWLMSKSIALIQYTKIVNEEDKYKSQELTFSMAKVSFWITLFFLIIVILIPESMFRFIFGGEFGGAKEVIYTLGIGILIISISTTFAHYFGGIARYDINNKASLVGLLVTVTLTVKMVEEYQMIGAGITTSLAYLASGTYHYYMFRKESDFKLAMLLPTQKDFIRVKKLFE